VRWFGGTKLGKGGLARAYAGATVAALATLPTREEFPARELALTLPYEQVGAVKRLLHAPEVVLLREEYGAAATLHLRVAEERLGELRAALAELRIATPIP
jgi:putative IMPACT (imprinted ancient) family translation regulator